MRLPQYVLAVALLFDPPEIGTRNWVSNYLARGMKDHAENHRSADDSCYFHMYLTRTSLLSLPRDLAIVERAKSLYLIISFFIGVASLWLGDPLVPPMQL